jgi:hypothetical protein
MDKPVSEASREGFARALFADKLAIVLLRLIQQH